jgi:hypothetical protein
MRIPLFRGEAFEIIAFFALPPPGLSRGLGEASSHGKRARRGLLQEAPLGSGADGRVELINLLHCFQKGRSSAINDKVTIRTTM